MNQIEIEALESRSEIIRVRVSPAQKKQFAAYSASIGMRSATVAYKLAMSAMHAHVRRRHGGTQGAIHRPLKPNRSRSCPGAHGPFGVQPRARMLV